MTYHDDSSPAHRRVPDQLEALAQVLDLEAMNNTINIVKMIAA